MSVFIFDNYIYWSNSIYLQEGSLPYVNLLGDADKLHQLRADLLNQSIQDVPPFPDTGDMPPRVLLPMPVDQARDKLESLGFIMRKIPVQRSYGESEEWCAMPKPESEPQLISKPPRLSF